MEIESPTMENVAYGKTFKVLNIVGTVGMHMPEHHATHEAVILVKQGKAIVTMTGEKYLIQKGEVFIIPAGEQHTLAVLEAFEANVIMPVASTIEFENKMYEN
ncbi:MAG TPA: cupin domain-containing protein [Fulvivirga sp.]|nr:cupin domain-containing protein [Fulvivirga sp.]